MANLDIKEIAGKLIELVQEDENILEKLEGDPAGTISELFNVELPEQQINSILKAVKAKVNLEDLDELLGGDLGDKLGKLGKLFK